MMKRHSAIFGVTAALLLMSACTADTETETDLDSNPPDSVSPAPEATPADDTSNEVDDTSKEVTENDSSEAVTSVGTVTVDGASYDITEVLACDPYNEGPIERELELQGFGKHEGERVQINVYVQTIGGTPMHEVSWAGPEGIFGGPENPDVTVDEPGSRVYGSAMPRDAMTQEDTVEIEFDLNIPDETISCR